MLSRVLRVTGRPISSTSSASIASATRPTARIVATSGTLSRHAANPITPSPAVTTHIAAMSSTSPTFYPSSGDPSSGAKPRDQAETQRDHEQQQQQQQQDHQDHQDHQQREGEPIIRPDRALPAPGEGSADDAVTKLDVSGAGSTVRLDSLGPLVVNENGTVSRIGNWHQMTEFERKNTLRILGKRNEARLAALKAKGVGLDMTGQRNNKATEE
jgi:hypothetical protein